MKKLSKSKGLAAKSEKIEIRRRDGSVFGLRSKQEETRSPFDVPGVNATATTSDILDAVRESRER